MGTKIFSICLTIILAIFISQFNAQESHFTPSTNWNPTDYYPEDSNTNVSYYDQHISDIISKSVLEFSHKLISKLESNAEIKSQIFSPISIVSALHLLLLGAKGRTYDELIRLLNYDKDQSIQTQFYKVHEEFSKLIEDLLINDTNNSRSRPQPAWKFTTRYDYLNVPKEELNITTYDEQEISVSNGIFIQNGFSLRPDYKTAVESVYKSEIIPLNFQSNENEARNFINNWVKRKTHEMIPYIITDKIREDTKLIVASALYFKAYWEREFIAGVTKEDNFYPNGYNNPSIKIHMMATLGIFPYYDAKEYNCEIIGLPYKDEIFTMYIIHPYNSTRAVLSNFQNSLTADKIEDMIGKMSRRVSAVALPRFHIKYKLSLYPILRDLGLQAIFINEISDLSLIADELTNPGINSSGNESFNITNQSQRRKRGVTYKVESTIHRDNEPLRLKDFIINKRITKLNPDKKRTKREIVDPILSLKNLDELRQSQRITNPRLAVEDIIHSVNLKVDERGTEGGAASIASIKRSGPEILFRMETPFFIIIRHDTTKLPLFYGSIYEPTVL